MASAAVARNQFTMENANHDCVRRSDYPVAADYNEGGKTDPQVFRQKGHEAR